MLLNRICSEILNCPLSPCYLPYGDLFSELSPSELRQQGQESDKVGLFARATTHCCETQGVQVPLHGEVPAAQFQHVEVMIAAVIVAVGLMWGWLFLGKYETTSYGQR